MGYGIDPPQAPVTRMALLAALVDGDLDTALRVATGLLEEGVPFETVVGELLSPVQREVGVRWADGDLTVADEHAATAAAEDLVTLLAGGFAAASGPTVVVVCPEGDAHSLPARVVSAVLGLRGYRSVLLGASLPAPDLGDYLERLAPFAVALSISMPAALYRAVASITVAHEHRVPVVAGGRALRDDELLARRLGVDAWAGDADAAADVLDAWQGRAPSVPVAAPEVPPECLVIDTHRAMLLAAAVRPEDAEAGRDLVEEVNRLLDVVQGALLLDAPSLLVDQVAALRATSNGSGATPAVVDRVLARLVETAAGALPATEALLRQVAPEPRAEHRDGAVGQRRSCRPSRQVREAGADAALRRALGDAEAGRHLPVGKTTEVGELDRLALELGELRQRGVHLVRDRAPHDLLLDVGRCLAHRAGIALLPAPPRGLRAHEVERPTVGLGEEVGPQRSALGVELLGPGPEPDEHLLDHVVGERAVAHEAESE